MRRPSLTQGCSAKRKEGRVVVTDVSGQPIDPIFMGHAAQEGTDTLSRNVGQKLPIFFSLRRCDGVTSKICDIRLQKLPQINTDCCSNGDFSPAVKVFFLL